MVVTIENDEFYVMSNLRVTDEVVAREIVFCVIHKF